MFVATDLHGHSLFSDGRVTPEAYVELRRQQGLVAIALSDHDVLFGVPRAAAAASSAGLLLLPAVEVTSFLHFGTDRAEQFHVLAYFPPSHCIPPRLRATALYRRGVRVHDAWRAFVLEWLAAQPPEHREAIEGTDGLAQLEGQAFPGLQTMLFRVYERCPAAFGGFQRHHVRFWDDRSLFGWSPEEAIDCIRADGATDIVAHPVRYRDTERTRALLGHASGFEVYTSRHKPDVAEGYRQLATALGKLWTASTDDHQSVPYVRPREGTPVTTLEALAQGSVPLPALYEMSTSRAG